MGLLSKLFGEPPAPAERPVRPSTSPARADLGSRRILVVEPSIIMQKIIELTLDGATVVTAKDAQEAQVENVAERLTARLHHGIDKTR